MLAVDALLRAALENGATWVSLRGSVVDGQVRRPSSGGRRNEASPDGLRGPEGAFSLCTFMDVDALAGAGRTDMARLMLEKMLTYANHLGPCGIASK